MDPQTLLDKYSVENIPGITNLDTNGSPIHHEVYSDSLYNDFGYHIKQQDDVKGEHLVSYSISGRDPAVSITPLLRVVMNKKNTNYIYNVKTFIELLSDGTVPSETIERYLNHYVINDIPRLDEIRYMPVLYYGRMDAPYIEFLGRYGFNPNLPILFKDRRTGEFKKGLNALGLIDENIGSYIDGSIDYKGNAIRQKIEDDNHEGIFLTHGQKAAETALSLGADMQHRPEDVLEKMYGNTRVVNPRVRPVRQLYPHTFLSDKAHRHSLPDRSGLASFNLYMDDKDRQEMDKRLPTTHLLQQLELLKPEQKLALAKFFEQTGIEGVDELFHLLEEISRHHDSMNPYVTIDHSGRRMNTRYIMDKQRGGKNTKKKQRGGRRSKKIGKRSKKKSR